MKRLLLLRHAKSSWSDEGADDHERPLAPRGVEAARRLGSHLARSGPAPDRVLCSSARRTLDTLELLRPGLPEDVRVAIERALYLAEAGALLERLRRLDATTGCVLLIGHNPGLAQLAATLAGSGDAGARTRLQRKFPTAALATLHFEVDDWAELAPGRGRLDDFVTPESLAQRGA